MILVSLPEQRAYVYRNGVGVGVSTVSTGKPGHRTPTGIFTILNKDKDHRSKTYNDAPMPYSERLTWDGIALHAGGLPGYPSSHGCVHLPSKFAELLFGITEPGFTVVIADASSAPADVARPSLLAPVSGSGAPATDPALPADVDFRWEPGKSPQGPMTILVSAADKRILVYRNGVEIGRARIAIADPARPLGTEAFVLKAPDTAASAGETPDAATRLWVGIALPGEAKGAGQPMDLKDASRVGIPTDFRKAVVAALTPGTTLYVTDAPVLPETTGPALNVLNSDPPTVAP